MDPAKKKQNKLLGQTLTPPEKTILMLMREGFQGTEIATKLGKSKYTIYNQRLSIYRKTGSKNQLECLRNTKGLSLAD